MPFGFGLIAFKTDPRVANAALKANIFTYWFFCFVAEPDSADGVWESGFYLSNTTRIILHGHAYYGRPVFCAVLVLPPGFLQAGEAERPKDRPGVDGGGGKDGKGAAELERRFCGV